MSVHHQRRLLRTLSLALTALVPACGGGGSGGGTSTACASAPSAGLGGTWFVTSEVIELDETVSETYLPVGLENVALELERVFSFSEQGQCWSAYTLSSASLDTSSPSGYPSSLQGLSSATIDDTLLISGLYYYPAGDVTVDVHLLPGPHTWLSESQFTVEIPFHTYAGQHVVSIVDGIPGEDDDGDGIVDEADEEELDDAVDLGAELVCEGRLRLHFSRTPLTVQAKQEPVVVLSGTFRSQESDRELDADIHVRPASRTLEVVVRDLAVIGSVSRLLAFADEEGRFCTRLERAGGQAAIHGRIESGGLEACTLIVLSDDHRGRYEFGLRDR